MDYFIVIALMTTVLFFLLNKHNSRMRKENARESHKFETRTNLGGLE
jgi:hypothetical protein